MQLQRKQDRTDERNREQMREHREWLRQEREDRQRQIERDKDRRSREEDRRMLQTLLLLQSGLGSNGGTGSPANTAPLSILGTRIQNPDDPHDDTTNNTNNGTDPI